MYTIAIIGMSVVCVIAMGVADYYRRGAEKAANQAKRDADRAAAIVETFKKGRDKNEQ